MKWILRKKQLLNPNPNPNLNPNSNPNPKTDKYKTSRSSSTLIEADLKKEAASNKPSVKL
jgi:hypothetical protein